MLLCKSEAKTLSVDALNIFLDTYFYFHFCWCSEQCSVNMATTNGRFEDSALMLGKGRMKNWLELLWQDFVNISIDEKLAPRLHVDTVLTPRPWQWQLWQNWHHHQWRWWNWCWFSCHGGTRWHTLIQLIRWRCWWQIKNSIVTLPGKVQPRCHHLLAKMSSNPRLTYNIVLDKSIIYKIYSVYLIYTLKSLVDYDMKNAGLWDAIDWQAKTLYCLVIFSESGKDAVIGSWQQLTSWEALPYMSMWQVILILQPMGRQ